MSLDSLYAELGVDFKPEDRNLYLEELADIAGSYPSELGAESAANDQATPLQRLAAELGKEEVAFAPRLNVLPLSQKQFAERKIVPASHVASLFDRFDFYLIDVPMTLLPRPEWGYQRLECRIQFNPDGAADTLPVAYQVFPDEDWQDMLHASTGLSIGLDENLEFKVDPTQIAEIGDSLPIKVGAKLKAAGKAGLVMGPFDYYIRRPRIEAKGRGSAKIIWRLEGEDRIVQKDPRLGVVLQVPTGATQVDAIAALRADRSFHWLSAPLHQVWNSLTQPLKTWLELGAPATAEGHWSNIMRP